jgi:hypothetical protein
MEGAALLATVPSVGQDMDWTAQGYCARSDDPEMWFAPAEEDSPRYAHMQSRKARQIARAKDRNRAKEKCRACPVRGECLRYAIGNSTNSLVLDGDFGIWGGLDKSERTKLKIMLAANEVAA